MTCEIIAHASSRYAAKYQVQARGQVYEAHVKDLEQDQASRWAQWSQVGDFDQAE